MEEWKGERDGGVGNSPLGVMGEYALKTSRFFFFWGGGLKSYMFKSLKFMLFFSPIV